MGGETRRKHHQRRTRPPHRTSQHAHRNRRLTTILILTSFTLLSLATIQHRALHPDEAFRQLLSHEDLRTLISTDTHPPLYLLLMRTGITIHNLRILNILLTLTGSLALGLTSIKRGHNPTITIAVYLSTFQVLNYTAWALNTAPALALLCWNTYAYTTKNKPLYAATGLLMAGTNSLTTIPLLGTFLYDTIKHKRIDFTILGTGILSSIWLLPIITNSTYTQWLHTPTPTVILTSIIVTIGSVPSIILLLFANKRQNAHAYTNTLLPFLLLLTTSLLWKPLYHDRYLVYAIPYAMLPISHALSSYRKLPSTLITILIVTCNLLLTPALYEHTWVEVAQANTAITTGNVLHHSTFSLYPSILYSPHATHYLQDENYTTPTPLLSIVHRTSQEHAQYDYELIASNETPTLTNATRTDYNGLSLYRTQTANNNATSR